MKSLDDSVELCKDNWIFSAYENIVRRNRWLQAACWKAFEGPESKGPKNPWPKKGVEPVTGMGIAGSVIRIEG